MQVAQEAVRVALDSVSTAEAINEQVRTLIQMAVETNGDRREVTFKLACAIADFADIWTNDADGEKARREA